MNTSIKKASLLSLIILAITTASYTYARETHTAGQPDRPMPIDAERCDHTSKLNIPRHRAGQPDRPMPIDAERCNHSSKLDIPRHRAGQPDRPVPIDAERCANRCPKNR